MIRLLLSVLPLVAIRVLTIATLLPANAFSSHHTHFHHRHALITCNKPSLKPSRSPRQAQQASPPCGLFHISSRETKPFLGRLVLLSPCGRRTRPLSKSPFIPPSPSTDRISSHLSSYRRNPVSRMLLSHFSIGMAGARGRDRGLVK